METSIKPELIAAGEPQKIVADLKPFDKAKEQVSLTVAELNKYAVITSEAVKADALSMLQIASKVEKLIETKRKDLVKPFNDGASAINAHAKEITEGLPKAILTVKNAVLKFQQEEEARALKLKKQARIKHLEAMGFVYETETDLLINGSVTVHTDCLAFSDVAWAEAMQETCLQLDIQETAKNQALQEEDPELAELLGLNEESPEPVAILPAPSTQYFAPPALKGASKVWRFEVTDPTLVPREFLAVDEVAIRKAVMAGSREIAGVRIYQEDKLSIR